MEQNKIDRFLSMNKGNFRSIDVVKIENLLELAPDEMSSKLLCTEFKEPMVSLLISIFFGGLGVDRFYLEQIGIGILKLITFGGLGIWAIVDLFLIMDATKSYNIDKLTTLVDDYIAANNLSSQSDNLPSLSESHLSRQVNGENII